MESQFPPSKHTYMHVCTHADAQIIEWPFQTASSNTAPPIIMERKGKREEECEEEEEEVRTAIESLNQLSRSWPAA